MASNTTPQNCEAPACLAVREVKEAVLDTKMDDIKSLLKMAFTVCLAIAGLLSYSVFWQAPNIRAEFTKEVNRLDKKTDDNKTELQGQINNVKQRLSALEGK